MDEEQIGPRLDLKGNPLKVGEIYYDGEFFKRITRIRKAYVYDYEFSGKSDGKFTNNVEDSVELSGEKRTWGIYYNPVSKARMREIFPEVSGEGYDEC